MKRAAAATLILCCILAAVSAPRPAAAQETAMEADSGCKVLCIGFDGMDPQLLRAYVDKGAMPRFAELIAAGDLRDLGTSMPPQSPVAWSNFITGADPGVHGIFDFIHRDPETLVPYLSAAQAMSPQRWWEVGEWRIPRGSGSVELLRHGTAFWELLADAGVDVTIFKIPANFPPTECEARTLSGMGTPDILGTYGIFSFYTDAPPRDTDLSGGRVIPLEFDGGRAETELRGPVNIYRVGEPESAIPFNIRLDADSRSALFDVQGERFLLAEGEWSPWLTVEFRLVPLLKTVRGVCRFFLMEAAPRFRLYATPINIDPSAPEMPISTPARYSADLARELGGPYYTQGLPDDTKALEEDVFDDEAYISQSDEVLAERMRQFDAELERFAGLDEGFLFFYFNSPDQTSHTFWRNMDSDSPAHDADAARHADRIERMYRACDQALGRALDAVGDQALVVALSDHGFAPYHRSFHLNRWLYDHGYLVLRRGVRPQDVEYLAGVDWSRTRAYAVGINGLYLNLRGREARGIVEPGAESDALLAELAAALEAEIDPAAGVRAVRRAYLAREIYHGPRSAEAPDIVVGYDRGYRGSNESALGAVPATVFSDNVMKWSGDHCMDFEVVPGVILANRPILAEDPELLDLAPTFLRLFGLEPPAAMAGKPIF